MVNDRTSGKGVLGSSPRMDGLSSDFKFSISDHSKYQTLVFYFQIDK